VASIAGEENRFDGGKELNRLGICNDLAIGPGCSG
jgi:hypothetical protein